MSDPKGDIVTTNQPDRLAYIEALVESNARFIEALAGGTA